MFVFASISTFHSFIFRESNVRARHKKIAKWKSAVRPSELTANLLLKINELFLCLHRSNYLQNLKFNRTAIWNIQHAKFVSSTLGERVWIAEQRSLSNIINCNNHPLGKTLYTFFCVCSCCCCYCYLLPLFAACDARRHCVIYASRLTSRYERRRCLRVQRRHAYRSTDQRLKRSPLRRRAGDEWTTASISSYQTVVKKSSIQRSCWHSLIPA